jgi:hypothetical protein
MTDLHRLAALVAIAGCAVIPNDVRAETGRGDWDDVLFGGPSFFDLSQGPSWTPSTREVTYLPETPKPLTKRQKRRLKGKQS